MGARRNRAERPPETRLPPRARSSCRSRWAMTAVALRAGRRARQGPEARSKPLPVPQGPATLLPDHGAAPDAIRSPRTRQGGTRGRPPERAVAHLPGAPDFRREALLGTTGFRITHLQPDSSSPSGVKEAPDERPRAGGARGHHAHGRHHQLHHKQNCASTRQAHPSCSTRPDHGRHGICTTPATRPG